MGKEETLTRYFLPVPYTIEILEPISRSSSKSINKTRNKHIVHMKTAGK